MRCSQVRGEVLPKATLHHSIREENKSRFRTLLLQSGYDILHEVNGRKALEYAAERLKLGKTDRLEHG